MIKVPEAQTSGKAYSNLALQATLPGVKRPPCLAIAFLGKCAFIKVVALAQRIGS